MSRNAAIDIEERSISLVIEMAQSFKRSGNTSASDEDALKAYQLVSKFENISPSLEPSHAFAEAIRLAPKLKSSEVIIVNSCGDSLKDKDIIKQRLGSYIR